jgi:hypothetical protein
MSYTDYLRRKIINSPVLIDSRMRMPDASSFTWRTKLEATQINRRTDHVINNSQDTPAPRLFSPQVLGYPGSGFGGRVQDASSFTLLQSARSLRNDVFSGPFGGRHRTSTNAIVGCLTRPPASQVVSELGNADHSVAGLNMGYTRQRSGSVVNDNVGVCTAQFRPQTKSYFVDTIPDLKTRKIGMQSRNPGDGLGRQIVQNEIDCVTTNTSGVAKSFGVDANGVGLQDPKADIPFNSYSATPKNSIGSGPNIVNRMFITSPTGIQTGGGNTPGSRAPIVGGVSMVRKGSITHRGWASPSRNPYPEPRVPPRGAPAQKKINDPNHYKI